MVNINGNELFVQDTGGDKPALLFVHGIMMDHTVWFNQVERFSPDYRVVCVDLRGYGQSTTNSPEISFEDHADDLLSLITHLGLEGTTLIGWSMGGAIGQILAANHQTAISRNVFVGSTPQLLADENFEHALPVEAAQQLGGLLVDDFAAGCGAFCGMIAPEDEAVAQKLTKISAATRPDVALSAFQSSGARNQLTELGKISTPSWVIVGENDAICMPEASDFMAGAIPGCTTGAIRIKGTGHAPFLTAPDTFNDALDAALN